jgi:hypothetical protein
MVRAASMFLQVAGWLVLLLLVGSLACQKAKCGDLPINDAGKPQLVIVGRPDVEPATWFETIPELKQVKNAVAFTLYSPDSKLFRERYAATLGTDYPIVAYLRSDGGVVYFADKHSLPSGGKALFAEMKTAVFQAKNAKPSAKVPQDLDIEDLADCPDGNCPAPFDEAPNSKPLFPRLRPVNNPLDGDGMQVDRLFSGAVSNTISSGLWMVFSGVVLVFIFLGMVLIFGAMIVVSKMW